MLAGDHFLLPCLDLRLAREGWGLDYGINRFFEPSPVLRGVDLAVSGVCAEDKGSGIVTVFFSLGRNSKL